MNFFEIEFIKDKTKTFCFDTWNLCCSTSMLYFLLYFGSNNSKDTNLKYWSGVMAKATGLEQML